MTYWISLNSPKNDLEREVIKHFDGGDPGHTRGSIEYLWDLISYFGEETPSEAICKEYDNLPSDYVEFAVID